MKHECCDLFTKLINYDKRRDEWTLWIEEAGPYSYFEVNYCPWCGEKLGDDVSSEWHKKLEENNLIAFKEGVDELFQVYVIDVVNHAIEEVKNNDK